MRLDGTAVNLQRTPYLHVLGTHTSLDKTVGYPYSGLRSGVFTPMLHCLYFSNGEYGAGMWSEKETAPGMPWGKEEMLKRISAPSCVRFSVFRQWGEGIESHVTSLRTVVNGDGAAWIGHSVKGQNRAVPRLAYWSTRTLKIRQWDG